MLYELSFDHRGSIAKGVDPDTGKPIRGHGRGFEQDILVFDDVAPADTSVVPRVVAEVKWGGVTTHDVIVYSEKADRIRRVYPYVRYGFVLGGMRSIPGRVLRLGQRFDFIASRSVSDPQQTSELASLIGADSLDIVELLMELEDDDDIDSEMLRRNPDMVLEIIEWLQRQDASRRSN